MQKLIFSILLTYLFNIPLSTVVLAYQKQQTIKIPPLSQLPTSEDIENRDSEASSRAQNAWESGKYNEV